MSKKQIQLINNFWQIVKQFWSDFKIVIVYKKSIVVSIFSVNFNLLLLLLLLCLVFQKTGRRYQSFTIIHKNTNLLSKTLRFSIVGRSYSFILIIIQIVSNCHCYLIAISNFTQRSHHMVSVTWLFPRRIYF